MKSAPVNDNIYIMDNSITHYNIPKHVKRISIDFDGVLMSLFMGRSWVQPFTSKSSKNGDRKRVKYIRIFFDIVSTLISFVTRFPIPGANEFLEKSPKRTKFILLTSRNSYLKTLTILWLRIFGVFKYFENFRFNDLKIPQAEFKVEQIKINDIDMHIDDNLPTIQKLSENYPDKVFIYFNHHKGKSYKGFNVIEMHDWKDLSFEN